MNSNIDLSPITDKDIKDIIESTSDIDISEDTFDEEHLFDKRLLRSHSDPYFNHNLKQTIYIPSPTPAPENLSPKKSTIRKQVSFSDDTKLEDFNNPPPSNTLNKLKLPNTAGIISFSNLYSFNLRQKLSNMYTNTFYSTSMTDKPVRSSNLSFIIDIMSNPYTGSFTVIASIMFIASLIMLSIAIGSPQTVVLIIGTALSITSVKVLSGFAIGISISIGAGVLFFSESSKDLEADSKPRDALIILNK